MVNSGQPMSTALHEAGELTVANDASACPSAEPVNVSQGIPAGAGERITLRDGRSAYLRPITPAARPLIEAAMRTLSPETSRRRFFTVRHELSDTELERMTRLDGWWQHAIGAVSVRADGRTEGVGVARWVRDADDPARAEFAMLIVDRWQRQGLGSALLTRLSRMALARGIERFTGSVLADNAPMFALIERQAPLAVRTRGRDFDTVEFLLAPGTLRVAA